jgi:hypothetical protein
LLPFFILVRQKFCLWTILWHWQITCLHKKYEGRVAGNKKARTKMASSVLRLRGFFLKMFYFYSFGISTFVSCQSVWLTAPVKSKPTLKTINWSRKKLSKSSFKIIDSVYCENFGELPRRMPSQNWAASSFFSKVGPGCEPRTRIFYLIFSPLLYPDFELWKKSDKIFIWSPTEKIAFLCDSHTCIYTYLCR